MNRKGRGVDTKKYTGVRIPCMDRRDDRFILNLLDRSNYAPG